MGQTGFMNHNAWNEILTKNRFFLRRFRDPIRVPRIREIGSLQIHTGYLTFSLKKPAKNFANKKLDFELMHEHEEQNVAVSNARHFPIRLKVSFVMHWYTTWRNNTFLDRSSMPCSVISCFLSGVTILEGLFCITNHLAKTSRSHTLCSPDLGHLHDHAPALLSNVSLIRQSLLKYGLGINTEIHHTVFVKLFPKVSFNMHNQRSQTFLTGATHLQTSFFCFFWNNFDNQLIQMLLLQFNYFIWSCQCGCFQVPALNCRVQVKFYRKGPTIVIPTQLNLFLLTT